MGQLLRLAVDRDCCMYKGKPDPTYRQKALSLVILMLFYYISIFNEACTCHKKTKYHCQRQF